MTQQTACQPRASPSGLEANNTFPHLGGSKSCAVFDNLHNDDVTMEVSQRPPGGLQFMNDKGCTDRRPDSDLYRRTVLTETGLLLNQHSKRNQFLPLYLLEKKIYLFEHL